MQLVPAILAAIIAGLLSAPYALFPAAIGWPLLGLLLIAAIALRRQPPIAVTLLLLACCLSANLSYPLQFKHNAAVDRAADRSQKLKITGTVLDVRARSAGRSSIDLRVSSVAVTDTVEVLSEPFVLRLFLDQQVAGLLPGDRVGFYGKLRKPRLFGIPGEFHWPRYLASQGVQATSWLKDVDRLQIEAGREFSFKRLIAAWKNRARVFISASLSAARAELVRGLVLGEGRSLPDETRRLLAAGGISHLFAISGLHLGLLALFGYRLLLLVYRRFDGLLLWQPPQRVLPLLMLPALLIYLMLTGDAVATRRAFCLAFAVALLLLWRRPVQPLRLLCSLALIFLLLNPLLLWQPSWQLSFSGAVGILLWQPGWQTALQSLPGYLKVPLGLLSVTIAATLATLPLVLFNFHLLAPVGPLANLLCVPLVAMLALPVGLLGLLLFPAIPLLAGYCFEFCGFILQAVLSLVGWLLSLPGLAEQYQYLTNRQYLALTVLLLPLLFFWQLRSGRFKLRSALPVVLFGGLLWVFQPTETTTTLTMFSVGQGESLLLRNRHRQAILVDGGGLYSKNFDVGERLLAPALGVLGVKTLTAVVLTHDHPDHRKGLEFILKQFPVEQFWAGVPLADLDARLRQIIVARGINFRQIEPGWSRIDRWKNGTMMTFRAADPVARKNDASLVLYLQEQDDGLLLTGDLERYGVGQLLAAGFPGPVTMLKLPHHGSRHSDSDRLLKRLQPQYCLVSAGYRNRYRLPAEQLLAQLDEREIPLFRTDLQGSIRAEATGHGWRLSRWYRGLFR